MKVYDNVRFLLDQFPECRNSDKELLWRYWARVDKRIPFNTMERENFLKTTPAESITRARRAVQKAHPELQATKQVQGARTKKAKTPNGWLY